MFESGKWRAVRLMTAAGGRKMIQSPEITQGVKCFECGTINWATTKACFQCNADLTERLRGSMFKGEATFARKVSRFFEITDYIMLIPATGATLYSLLLLSFAPLLPLAIVGWYVAGCFLLRGFYKHSRGRLSERASTLLWWATIGYNMAEVVFLSFFGQSGVLLSLWPLLIVLLSATALRSESQEVRQLSE